MAWRINEVHFDGRGCVHTNVPRTLLGATVLRVRVLILLRSPTQRTTRHCFSLAAPLLPSAATRQPAGVKW